MKVYEALARAFRAEGTTAIFGLMGDANMYWMNEMDRLGASLYEVRHEGGALAMADGWARATGEPGVVTTTCGPGVSQLATTMLVASRAGTPLVAFVGEYAQGDPENAQRFDQERFAGAIESGFVGVRRADDALGGVRKAFHLARAESRPVMLSVPIDLQQAEVLDDDDEYEYEASTSLLRPQTIFPDPEAVRAAAEVVAGCRRPVILAGRGAVAVGAEKAIYQLAEQIGAVVATTLLAKSALDDDDFNVGVSGLYSTRVAVDLFQDADCLIAVGAGLNRYTTEHGYLYPGATVIQLDTKPYALMSGGRSADHYLQTDARVGIEQLGSAIADLGFTQVGYRTPEVRERLEHAYDDPQGYEIEDGTLDPRQVCRVLDAEVPEHVGLVIGGGQNVSISTILMRRRRRALVTNQHYGCIGQGLTTGIGASLGHDRMPTLVMDGDASLMMYLAEFETAVRYDVPVLVVVMNDQQLGAEYHKAVASGLKAELAQVPTPDLGAVGQALGGRGTVVRDLDTLRAAVAEYVAHPAPTMLDVRISSSVLSIPYRRLLYGTDA